MRGDDQQQSGMFIYVPLEERVPQDHPLRRIRETVDEIVRGMAKDFDGLYAKTGRPRNPRSRVFHSNNESGDEATSAKSSDAMSRDPTSMTNPSRRGDSLGRRGRPC